MSIWVTGSLEVRNTSGDLVFQVGDSSPGTGIFTSTVESPPASSLTLNSNDDIVFMIDNDNDATGNFFRWRSNGSSANIMTLSDAGYLTTGDGLTVGNNVISSFGGGATLTMDSSNNVTIGNNLRVGGNVIQASDGGSTITMDTSDNVTIGGDLTVNGGDILGPTGAQLAIKSDGNAIIQVDADNTGGTPVFAVWDASQNPQFRVQLNAAGTDSVATMYGHAHVQENLNVTGSIEMGAGAQINLKAASSINVTGTFTVDTTSTMNFDSDTGQFFFKDGGSNRASILTDQFTLYHSSDTNDYFRVGVATNGATTIETVDSSNSAGAGLTIQPAGPLLLNPAGNVTVEQTSAEEFVIGGTNPALVIGVNGAEDARLTFDNATEDYTIGIDETDSRFKIDRGGAVGGSSAIQITAATIADPAEVIISDPLSVGGTITLQNSETIGNSVAGRIDLNAATTRLSGDLQVAGNDIKNSADDTVMSIGTGGVVCTGDVSATNVIATSLTDGRVALVGTGGEFTDSASLTYTTNRLAMEGGGVPLIVLTSDSTTMNDGSGLYLKRYVPSSTTPAAGYNVGELYFQASTDDITYQTAASVIVEFSETFQPSTAEGTRIVFNATPNGGTSQSQHLQIGGMDNAHVAIGSNPLTNGGGNAGLLIGVGSSNEARLDLIENTISVTEGFGTTGAYGFRVMYDGSTNKFIIQSGAAGTVTDRVTIARDTGRLTIPDVFNDTIAGSGNVFIDSAGIIKRATSDRRGKKDITDLSASLDQVASLLPRLFYDISDDSNSVHIPGFVADEVVDIFPELVPERNESDDVIRSVSYDRITAYIVSALKEVKDRLEALESSN